MVLIAYHLPKNLQICSPEPSPLRFLDFSFQPEPHQRDYGNDNEESDDGYIEIAYASHYSKYFGVVINFICFFF